MQWDASLHLFPQRGEVGHVLRRGLWLRGRTRAAASAAATTAAAATAASCRTTRAPAGVLVLGLLLLLDFWPSGHVGQQNVQARLARQGTDQRTHVTGSRAQGVQYR